MYGEYQEKAKETRHEFKNVDGLKSHVKSIYDEISRCTFQNRVDCVRDNYKKVLAIDGKHLKF